MTRPHCGVGVCTLTLCLPGKQQGTRPMNRRQQAHLPRPPLIFFPPSTVHMIYKGKKRKRFGLFGSAFTGPGSWRLQFWWQRSADSEDALMSLSSLHGGGWGGGRSHAEALRKQVICQMVLYLLLLVYTPLTQSLPLHSQA